MKSHTKNIIICYSGYVTVKIRFYIKTNSVNLLYLISVRINGYIEESNRSIYLRLVPTKESKDILEKYEELWNKIRDLII